MLMQNIQSACKEMMGNSALHLELKTSVQYGCSCGPIPRKCKKLSLDTEFETSTVQLRSTVAIFYVFNWSGAETSPLKSLVHFPKAHGGFVAYVHLH